MFLRILRETSIGLQIAGTTSTLCSGIINVFFIHFVFWQNQTAKVIEVRQCNVLYFIGCTAVKEFDLKSTDLSSIPFLPS